MYEIETTPEVGIMAASPIFKEMIYYMDNIVNLITIPYPQDPVLVVVVLAAEFRLVANLVKNLVFVVPHIFALSQLFPFVF